MQNSTGFPMAVRQEGGPFGKSRCARYDRRMTSGRGFAMGAVLVACSVACDRDDAPGSGPAVSDAPAPPQELTPELASKVLARVGEREITLGDYAAALDRMDRFARLRYQTPERRRMLLDEMINVELLAREAERRGLDEQPETRAEIRLLQREELLRRERAKLPKVEQLPASEVRAYYDEHKADYFDPERRRVAVLAVSSAKVGRELLEKARNADPKQWGLLVREHSVLDGLPARASKNEARPPLELEGDLGLVSAPGQARGQNDRVPEPVRAAVFQIEEQGGVFSELIPHRGKYYVVRLVGKSAARQRTFKEAEATIRVQLLQQKLRAAERTLVSTLRQRFDVSVNQDALAKLKLPETRQ